MLNENKNAHYDIHTVKRPSDAVLVGYNDNLNLNLYILLKVEKKLVFHLCIWSFNFWMYRSRILSMSMDNVVV